MSVYYRKRRDTAMTDLLNYLESNVLYFIRKNSDGSIDLLEIEDYTGGSHFTTAYTRLGAKRFSKEGKYE